MESGEKSDEASGEAATRRDHARRDLVLVGVLGVIAVVYAFQAFALQSSSPNQADIGPRAYPLLVLGLLVLGTVLLLVQSVVRLRSTGVRRGPGRRSATASRLARPSSRGESWQRWGHHVRLVGVVVVTVAYLQLMITLGFVIATAAFLAVEVVLIGGADRYRGRRALVPLVFGIVASVAIYLVFARSLGVLLPRGLLAL